MKPQRQFYGGEEDLVLSFTNHFVVFNYRNLEPRQLEPKGLEPKA